MATSEAQKRASAKYKRDKTKESRVRFYPADADIWEWLQAQPNKQGYIRNLIRADMEQRS